MITEPQQFEINEKSFFIGHGDGLGPGDTSYKLMKNLLQEIDFLSGALDGFILTSGLNSVNFFLKKKS